MKLLDRRNRDAWIMRISVISNETTLADGDIATDAILAAWDRVDKSHPGP